VVEITRANTAEALEYFHEQLDWHFRGMRERRKRLAGPAPVFALEHGLGSQDLGSLQHAVVAAHRERLLMRVSGRCWLPFVVHAAEVGYIYDGVEFWPIYATTTPGWEDGEYERDRVRGWFVKFAHEYGGATPQGAWAATFRKIAWPITHAVLPRYLQVQLAKMLSDYRTAWPSLLDDPTELGVRLHSWSRHYSDRLEKFCQNTALAGHVAVALLLSAEEEVSPYIESATLARLIENLNSERESRRWLHNARRSVSTVRMHNFRPSAETGGAVTRKKRLPTATDPQLQLKRERGVCQVYAVLPDLKPLQHSLPVVYDELRKCRAIVAGVRQPIPTGGLLYAIPPVRFDSWPAPTQAFLQLQRASDEVNLLIADQCEITTGPWWVFCYRAGAPAVEVKSKYVRPGGHYCILGVPDHSPPDVAWCEKVEIGVDGVVAYDLDVPAVLSDSDSRALVKVGISVISDVSIRPVGVVASRWDGEGSAEWLAGEPACFAVRAQHSPPKVQLTVNGEPHYIEWPSGETELFLTLDRLCVGIHEIVVSLGDLNSDGRMTEGTLIATIRDPEVRCEGASSGEGIRLRTVPAQPSLPELWDGLAVVVVDGPAHTTADLALTLRDSEGVELGCYRRSLQLPVTGNDWRRLFGTVRKQPELAKHYDEADIVDVVVSRAGIGFAILSCERGFEGLRWVVTTQHRHGGYAARLIDRTDGNRVSVDFFSVEHPLVGQAQPVDREFIGPPCGGLLWATNGEQVAGQIIPPDPKKVFRLGVVQPSVPLAPKSLTEVHKLLRSHRLWKQAELPAHPFGMWERQRVLAALTAALAELLAPGRWASFEQQNIEIAAGAFDLSRAQSLIGESPAHRAVSQTIANNILKWNSPEVLIGGFSDAIADLATSAGMPDGVQGARLLLQLASSPGELLDWDQTELDQYLRCVLTDPVLVRAARFAVLATAEQIAEGVR